MNKKTVRIDIVRTIFVIAWLCLSSLLFAQDITNDFDLELEDSIKDEKINKDLQKDFIVIAPAHNYNLNPHTAAYNAEVQILTGLYEGLFTYDPITLNPVYAIAKSHHISRDKKKWTFTIREDATFSDGTKITAEDIKRSWLSMLKNPDAPYSSLFEMVKGAEDFRCGKTGENSVGIYVIDDYSLSVNLTNPAAHLSRLLCMSAFAVVSENPNVYSGPFVLSEFTNENIILEKNKNYYDKENTALEKITFLLSDDDKENTHLFNTGKADWINSSVDLSKILSTNAKQISAEFATEYLFFKMRNNIWEKTEFRQALLEAVPWQELRTNVIVPATTLVYPLNGYPKAQGYVYTDKIEAMSLMENAKLNANIENDEKLEIVMAITPSERMKKNAEILKNAWQSLGVELKTVILPFSDYLQSIPITEADIFSYTWIGDFSDPLAFLELFRGNSNLNVSKWNNAEYNKILTEAATLNDLQHLECLSRAEQILLDEAVILPIQHPVSLNIIDLNAVGGWTTNAFDIHPLKYLYKKEVKFKVDNLVMGK